MFENCNENFHGIIVYIYVCMYVCILIFYVFISMSEYVKLKRRHLFTNAIYTRDGFLNEFAKR